MKGAKAQVNEKLDRMKSKLMSHVICESRVLNIIDKLRLGCAPGLDGIMAEHVRHATNSKVISHLSIALIVISVIFSQKYSFSQFFPIREFFPGRNLPVFPSGIYRHWEKLANPALYVPPQKHYQLCSYI